MLIERNIDMLNPKMYGIVINENDTLKTSSIVKLVILRLSTDKLCCHTGFDVLNLTFVCHYPKNGIENIKFLQFYMLLFYLFSKFYSKFKMN